MGIWLTALGVAMAARALIVAPGGDPLPGVRADLEVITWDAGGPVLEAPELRAGVEVIPLIKGDAPGSWRGTWTPPLSGPGHVVLTLKTSDGERLPLEVKLGSLPAPTLTPPARSDGVAAGEVLRLRFLGAAALDGLKVFAPEGEVSSLEATDEGVVVHWSPGPSRAARVVPIGVLDERRPAAPPAWTVVHLKATPEIDINTEAGATVTMTVGDRTYGPVTADASGVTTLHPEVYPGETQGEAALVDDLGNVRRVSVPLAEEPGPTLVAAPTGPAEQGRLPPPVHLFAVDSTGAPWTPAPRCRSAAVDRVDVVPAGEARWLAVLSVPDPGALLDLRLDCVAERGGQTASTSARLPLAAGRPSRLVLRVFPSELTADMPVAQVQAYVEDALGERLPPERLTLSADRGRLEAVERTGTLARAEYVGEGIGLSDKVRAQLAVELAEGVPWELELRPTEDALMVRALDRSGRALMGAPVSGAVGGPGALEFEGRTDERGWFSVPLSTSAAPRVASVRSGDVERRAALLPWVEAPAVDRDAPALASTVDVRVRAGRVQDVQIFAEPSLLYTGSGETAAIRVRLLDRAGIPVVDEAVKIDPSAGEVGPTRVLADGTLEATYEPPPGFAYGSVIVIVSGEDGTFTGDTNLELQPRPVNRSITVVGGYLSGLGEISSPYIGADFDWRLPLRTDGVIARFTVGGWRDRFEGEDLFGNPFEAQITNLMFSPALAWRQEVGIWSAWGGVGMALVPFQLLPVFETNDSTIIRGVHVPGLTSFAGVGRRTLGGELVAELRGVGVQAANTPIEYDGQVGGLAILAGYRVLY